MTLDVKEIPPFFFSLSFESSSPAAFFGFSKENEEEARAKEMPKKLAAIIRTVDTDRRSLEEIFRQIYHPPLISFFLYLGWARTAAA